MEVIPGKGYGIYKIGMSKSELIEIIDVEYSEKNRGVCTQISTQNLIFNISNNSKLTEIIIKNGEGANYNGISCGSKIEDIIKSLGELDINPDGILYLPGSQGIMFELSEEDNEYLYETGASEDGVTEEYYDLTIDTINILDTSGLVS